MTTHGHGRVLFISHNGTRTGAPIVLLRFLRWLRENTDLDFEVLVRFGGPLVPEFAQIAPTTVVFEEDGGAVGSIPERLLKKLGAHPDKPGVSAVEGAVRRKAAKVLRQRFEQRLPAPGTYELIYANSTGSLTLLPHLDPLVPLVVHVHEMDYALLHCEDPRDVALIKDRADSVIAASHAVRDVLVGPLGVLPDRIEVCHEFVDFDESIVTDAAAARRELGIPDDAMIVGASGTLDWRKGPELFLQVARGVLQALPGPPKVYFVWLGGDLESRYFLQVAHDLERMGLGTRVLFPGSRADPWSYFAAFDVFTLTSREDPYPLVCLEVASLGRPFVCFDAGGMKEFIEPGAGVVVPYADVNAMVDALVELLTDEGTRTSMGATAKERVLRRHGLDAGCRPLYEVIRRCLP